jgi:hypothetical protein
MKDIIVDSTGELQLSPIAIDEAYAKKWNESSRDFVVLTKGGNMISQTLYRVGGIGTSNIKGKRYFMLLKYVEAYYPANIMQMSKSTDPKHLEGRWVIIDENGVEKVVFESFKHGWLVADSVIYSLDQKYYNIETGEFYCQSFTSMSSDEYLFLNNEFDKDESKRGVMKINKKDGTFELFPKS